MKINVTLPFDRIDRPTEFVTMEAVREIAGAAEAADFAGGFVTDHPCPTGRWLDAGGHYAHDPFVMLSLVAAATTRLRLMTGILVLPYRNPFIVARAVATLDVFSKGRVTLGIGAGYLKGEFRALGVDFEKRNEIMDEYIRALKAAWSGEDFAFKGETFEALGNRIRPAPVQRPHPPLLIGGNSRRAIRRAAELGDAWHPFFASDQVSATARTQSMSDELDLADGIKYLKEHCEKVGRAAPPGIVLASVTKPGAAWEPGKLLDRLHQFRALGVSAAAAHMDGETRAEWLRNAERFGKEIIERIER